MPWIMCLCPSVCPSVTRRSSIKADGRIEPGFFEWELISTCPTPFDKEILVASKIRVLPSETPSQTLVLKNYFATGSRWWRCWWCVNKTRQRSSLWITPRLSRRRAHTTRRSTVTLQLHNFVLLWIFCTTCSYSCAAVDKISTDTARRAVPLRLSSFLFLAIVLCFYY